ncbi:chorismate mutase [Agaricicola taiwanensis]|uniref:chorismate mutase n=1 Tax=Agaricicola taiwanensis TaxID=591372 RepID=A0A8J2YJK1_9RHOB|nr:chorismate mutase [Agaricicola taiwanensis]GGE47086.1 chorismate mutase [Agaricicola taiwanensis]
MTKTLRDPRDCADMGELRAAIDVIDVEIIGMLARRVGYIDRAVELKRDNGLPANIPDRVEDVVEKVRAEASRIGYDPELAEKLYRIMISWSIDREERRLG